MIMHTLASGSPLPGFLNSLTGPLNHYGLLAVLFFVLIEDFGIPVPGETILIAASIYAGSGRLNVVAVGVIGFVAAVAGDNIGFAIGHYGGRALVLRWGRFLVFNSVGAALWVGTWVSLGYFAGNHIGTIYHYITRYSAYALIALAVLLA